MNPFTILKAVSAESGHSVEMLLGPRRMPDLVAARWVAALLMRERCGFGKTTIGSYINRDHTTVIHGLRTAQKRMGKDRYLTGLYTRAAARLSLEAYADAAE